MSYRDDDWITDLDLEEKIKLRKRNRRQTIEDYPRTNKKGHTVED